MWYVPRDYANQIPAFPEGWYYVANRKHLLKEKLIRKTWMGEEIIIWCNDAGNICVADAFCPHVGADLAAHGLRC